MWTSPRPAVDLVPIRDLCEDYERVHGFRVRLWIRRADGWLQVAGGDEGLPRGPSPDAEHIFDPGGTSWAVEVEARPDVPHGSAGFLGRLLARNLAYQAESVSVAREIADRYEEITLLYTISEIFGSVITLEEASATILREVVETLGVRRATLWLHDPDRGTLHLVASVGGDGHSDPISVDDRDSLTASVFRNQRPMILEAGEEVRRAGTSPADRDPVLSVPVNYTPPRERPRSIGVINLVGRTIGESFSAGDQKLITAIATQIGAAVENNRLVADSLRQERLDREMELAHDLQLKLLPSVKQFRDRGEVAARCVPADSVGGDFYHLFRLSGGRLGVMIGDVSSHGFAAALIMALTMSAVAIHASEGDPPSEVLRRLHRALIDELESTEMYLSLFYGVIDPESRRITFANAGHSHAFRVTGKGEAQRLATTNPPFGIIDLDDYGEQTLPWTPGEDTLVLFTDGLADAISQANGERRLLECVAQGRSRSLEELLGDLFDIQPESEGVPPDDRSAVLVRV